MPTLTPLTDALFDEAWTSLEESFGGDPHPADRQVERDVVDPARFLVALDEGRVVGTAGSFAHRTTLPGAVVPVAGVSWVGVLPTHRRRGLLTALLTRLLHERHEAGEAVAALWASEAAIYQRFGFGPASWHLSVTLPRRAPLATPPVSAPVRRVVPTAELLAPVYDQVRARTPGWSERGAATWAYRLHDPEHRRSGGSAVRCVVTDGGYALYATSGAWDVLPAGEVRVRELVATTPQAHGALWAYLLDQDLTTSVTARVAVDDPLLQQLAEPRAARARLSDGLWVRPLDVGAALASRAYGAPVDVVLDVTDALCPWNTGRWRLAGDPAGAVCARTTDAADLVVGVADLGAALLGGTTLLSRAAAGRVQEVTPGSLRTASLAFGALGAQPSCPMVF